MLLRHCGWCGRGLNAIKLASAVFTTPRDDGDITPRPSFREDTHDDQSMSTFTDCGTEIATRVSPTTVGDFEICVNLPSLISRFENGLRPF